MSMDGDILERVRKLEKQVEALLERHPEVRAVLERGAAAMMPQTHVSTSVVKIDPVDIRYLERLDLDVQSVTTVYASKP